MATQEKKQPGTQPAEDMFGRPTSPHPQEPSERPRQEPPDAGAGKRAREDEEEEEESDEEHGRGGIDDIPDGDGPRSDRGTNPLPTVYWTSYPGD
ncbi:hypothetical protein [Stigmatella aurantiaca]|uniref:Uncharacterized protein n=1 Tax=Stigmatella aurantiaca (strain DW4/3-1) TaxID=378806 RepID=Q08ZL6_STIAD|nr:hypothetical protein [Stigmatella aurantiaca]ADO68216.1 uncharacterized protein STAUR_0407 [Stigmatella aurantiaca DW4/3-1]EAU65933.1 hypothetical protein STIAU_1804 [Stigmatella aurantiaca DW4/3-1]